MANNRRLILGDCEFVHKRNEIVLNYSKNNDGGVYAITNNITNHCYIGSSIDYHSRIAVHILELSYDCHHNKHLQKDWNQYGEKAFSYELIWKCEKNESKNFILYMEQTYIDKYNPEYNIQRQVEYIGDITKTRAYKEQTSSINPVKRIYRPKKIKKEIDVNSKQYIIPAIIDLIYEQKWKIQKAKKGLYYIGLVKNRIIFKSKPMTIYIEKTKETISVLNRSLPEIKEIISNIFKK